LARFRKGDPDGAISDYTKAIELDPRYAQAYGNRGLVRESKGDLDGAISDYTKAIEMDPRHALANYNRRGVARYSKGDPEGAISDYTKAIELDPRDVQPYNNLAWLWATSPKEAVRDGKKAVEYALKAAELTNWQEPNVLDTLAAAYAEAGKFDEAVKWQNKALSSPDYVKTYGEEGRQRLQLYTQRKPFRDK
ncbi:MAG: tetratricopeptide repeat protein, partial [Acidobacteriota bacterium]|nr:tetratricopeptide repeat protein [Acidobacteriota bacterium]